MTTFSKLIIFLAAAGLVSALPQDAPAADAPAADAPAADAPAADEAAKVAPPPVIVTTTTINKCNVGSVQCCKTVQNAASQEAQNQAKILNVAIGHLTGLIGLDCNPISVIGVGAGSNCNGTPVCCKGNESKGLVATGCGAINANL